MSCKIENGKITLCKELEELFLKYDTQIQPVDMVQMSNVHIVFIGAVTFKYGRKKSEIVKLSYCPFCGGNLI
jgi:hypothetical protein